MQRRNSHRAVVAAALVLAAVSLAAVFFPQASSSTRPALVVYCAHDLIYSEAVLREFEKQTGIRVSIVPDTEATKSLGLVNRLIREQDHPVCDVFWNNEILGTMDLARRELLQPYQSPAAERIPAAFKEPQGAWTGFAARMRVCIVNTEKMPATEEALAQALAGDLSRMAVAKPLYGTTLTHYTVLWDLWGGDRLRQWHHEARRRGLREAAGNAMVKNLVAAGVCDFGWTDTDDYFQARDDGKPVALILVRADNGKVICIPNTVAIIRGTKRQHEAQQLVDFLLSAETESALARSGSRQIPLGKVNAADLPPEVRDLSRHVVDSYDLSRLESARTECLDWLKSEYTP